MNKTKLKGFFEIKHGFAFQSKNYVNKSKYILVTLANISETNQFQEKETKRTYYGGDFPKEFILREGDLIMPLTEQVIGLLGNSAFIPKNEDGIFVLNQRVGKVVVNEERTDKYFLHYLLSTDSVKKQLEYRASGTKQRNISPDDVYDVTVLLPDLTNQKKIGHLLYKIENKIDVNNKINKELEQTAKDLYNYWFVQFDFPDENKRPYKSNNGKMVYNDILKKEIPYGWNVKNLLDVVEWIGGSQPPKSTFINKPKDGYVRFIQNRDYAGYKETTYIKESNANKLCDIFDIMMDKYGDAGKVRYGLAGAYNVALSKIKVNIENGQEYIRKFFESKQIHDYLFNACIASTRASLNEDIIGNLYIPIPPKNILCSFEKQMKKYLTTILNNNNQNKYLTDLRDKLLPLLMNGQVKVLD